MNIFNGILRRNISDAKQQYDVIVCIYTCQRHASLLADLYDSVIGKALKELPSVKILEVYADPNIRSDIIINNKLIVKTEERYENLCNKTFKMIKKCVQNFSFKTLLKIDVTVIMREFKCEKYKNRLPVDTDILVNYINNLLMSEDYHGIMEHKGAKRSNAENWALKKGGKINYKIIFGENDMPNFYSGKCYSISHRFATYISKYGSDMAKEQKRYFLGAEDVMIGRLYWAYKNSLDLK